MSLTRFPGRSLSAAILSALAMLSGCSSSPWEAEYRGSGSATMNEDAIAATGTLRVREVPWERIQNTLQKLAAERIASDIHPDDWDPARKSAAKGELLRGLQVSQDPGSVQILGRSDFRTTDRLDRPAEDPELLKFARKIGATTVIWSSSYLGKTDVVRSEPVTEWRSGSWSSRHESSGSRSFSENSTIWVPVVVQQDERAWMAYFLRETR